MSVKITSPIISYEVVKESEDGLEATETATTNSDSRHSKRPDLLFGVTKKITNHADSYNIYLTVNYYNGKPFEVFIDSSHIDAAHWVKGLSRVISMSLQHGVSLSEVTRQLCKVHSPAAYFTGGHGGFVNGVVDHIGKELANMVTLPDPTIKLPANSDDDDGLTYLQKSCPQCGEQKMIMMDGCPQCMNPECNYSKCQ